MANQKKVEHHAILALQAYFDDCDNVDSSFIAINDKRPALDGDIDVYQVVDQEQFSKRNLRFSMPVQVKGTTRQMLNNKFPVSIADLRYYEAHTQGLVYFVISEFKNERTIFYKKLAPIDVKDILAGKNGATESKNSTKSLKFKVLPKDPQVFLNILSDFHRQCSLQSKNVLDLSGVREPSDKIFLNVRSKQKFLEDTLGTLPSGWTDQIIKGLFSQKGVFLCGGRESVTLWKTRLSSLIEYCLASHSWMFSDPEGRARKH